jgi:hypothetical protein
MRDEPSWISLVEDGPKCRKNARTLPQSESVRELRCGDDFFDNPANGDMTFEICRGLQQCKHYQACNQRMNASSMQFPWMHQFLGVCADEVGHSKRDDHALWWAFQGVFHSFGTQYRHVGQYLTTKIHSVPSERLMKQWRNVVRSLVQNNVAIKTGDIPYIFASAFASEDDPFPVLNFKENEDGDPELDYKSIQEQFPEEYANLLKEMEKDDDPKKKKNPRPRGTGTESTSSSAAPDMDTTRKRKAETNPNDEILPPQDIPAPSVPPANKIARVTMTKRMLPTAELEKLRKKAHLIGVGHFTPLSYNRHAPFGFTDKQINDGFRRPEIRAVKGKISKNSVPIDIRIAFLTQKPYSEYQHHLECMKKKKKETEHVV